MTTLLASSVTPHVLLNVQLLIFASDTEATAAFKFYTGTN